ncbi:CG11652-like protein [Neoconidiobolus thromboides FSU 785]|nr:CG11652-like protein [Neoconidiobolus thromboides FSU 785]
MDLTTIKKGIEDIEDNATAPKSRASNRRLWNQIPEDILNDELLNMAIKQLPSNYNFEIHKSIWQIKKFGATKVALQFPEGILMFACTIADILERFCDVKTVIMGDVTYGACCVDDFTAKALKCDFLLHYGHSCLVPVDITSIKTLYIFVDISINIQHFIDTVEYNFEVGSKLALVGTIQFGTALQASYQLLSKNYQILIPQSKPLSPGEILGCTAPKINSQDALIYLGDGRFHLEAAMIANPDLPAYRYDPYNQKFTREYYNHSEMHEIREFAIQQSKKAKNFGIILGTLGRQGSNRVLEALKEKIEDKGLNYSIILLSEIFPTKLNEFENIDVFVQIACPRLSIDWGYAFNKPLLTPYEVNVALDNIEFQDVYPMDFYANESLGNWTPNHNNHLKNKNRNKKNEKVLSTKNKTSEKDKEDNGCCGSKNKKEEGGCCGRKVV